MALPSVRMKKRILIFLGIVSVLVLCLVLRVGWLQVVDGAQLKTEAIQQQTRDELVSAKRGTIYDRNGETLARSASVESVSVTPNEISKAGACEEVARTLSQLLELDYDEVYKKVSKDSKYEVIKRKILPEQATEIRRLKTADETKKAFAGVTLYEDSKRYYPFGNFASQLLGTTGADNQGLDGIEAAYDKQLMGQAGRVISAKNARGTSMFFQYEEQQIANDGENIVLTIDQNIQHFVEKHLETAVIESGLQNGAAAIVMDPRTGEILAMATKEDFDPNDPFALSPEAEAKIMEIEDDAERAEARQAAIAKMWRNKALSDTYEPGSTFKIITSAIGLEEGVVGLNDSFYCSGSVKIPGYPRPISCHNAAGHGAQNFVQGVENSCNPVFIEVGSRIGTEKFFQYFKNFGFTQKTGIDLNGEAIGVYHPENKFTTVDLAVSSFGQSFQVTPLQMVTAVSAVVNGGYLMKPYLVKELRDSEDRILHTTQPEVVRQVISKETSATMRSILESVVANGTGKNAYVPGYRIGGKTGTSEKAPRGSDKRIASFVGFAPADDPQVVCLVMLDEPSIGSRFGGTIAAPVVGKIMQDILEYLGIEKQYTAEEIKALGKSVPELRSLTLSEAQAKAKEAKFNYKVSGSGEMVIDQLPKPGVTLAEGSTIILYTQEKNENSLVTVPDVTGKTAGEAKAVLQSLGLNYEVVGTGATDINSGAIIEKQSPAPGEKAEPASVVGLEFRHLSED